MLTRHEEQSGGSDKFRPDDYIILAFRLASQGKNQLLTVDSYYCIKQLQSPIKMKCLGNLDVIPVITLPNANR